jgi:hypothetical protein
MGSHVVGYSEENLLWEVALDGVRPPRDNGDIALHVALLIDDSVQSWRIVSKPFSAILHQRCSENRAQIVGRPYGMDVVWSDAKRNAVVTRSLLCSPTHVCYLLADVTCATAVDMLSIVTALANTFTPALYRHVTVSTCRRTVGTRGRRTWLDPHRACTDRLSKGSELGR